MIKKLLGLGLLTFTLASCELPFDDGGDKGEDIMHDTIDHHPLSYSGMISGFRLDLN